MNFTAPACTISPSEVSNEDLLSQIQDCLEESRSYGEAMDAPNSVLAGGGFGMVLDRWIALHTEAAGRGLPVG